MAWLVILVLIETFESWSWCIRSQSLAALAWWRNGRAQGTKLGSLRSLIPLRSAAWSIWQSTFKLDLGKPFLKGFLLYNRIPVLRSLRRLVRHFIVKVGSSDLWLMRELLLEHWLLHCDLLHLSMALKLLVLHWMLLLKLAGDSRLWNIETIDNWVCNLAWDSIQSLCIAVIFLFSASLWACTTVRKRKNSNPVFELWFYI